MRRTLLLHLWLQTGLWVALAVGVAHLASALPLRLDLTGDQRFTLSEPARQAVTGLQRPLVAEVWFTPDLDVPYHAHERALLDLLAELRAASGGRLEVRRADPTDPAAVTEARALGIRPVTYTRQDWDRAEARQVFMGLTLSYGSRRQAVDALLTVERMELEVVRAIRAVTTERGGRRTIGWLQGNGEPDLSRPEAGSPLAALRDELGRSYDVMGLNLDVEPVPEEVDALLVVGPVLPVPAQARLHLDQFVMRGGAVGWFLTAVQPDFRTMALRDVRHDLHDQLLRYGVAVGRDVIVDRVRNEPMNVPVGRATDRAWARVHYPLAPVTTRIDRSERTVRGLQRAVLPFSTVLSPLDDLPELDVVTWIESGPDSVAVPDLVELSPTALMTPATGERTGPFPVVVALTGTFRTAFPGASEPGAPLESPPTRMIVASSADLVPNNVPFVLDATEWLLEDGSLAAIRARDAGDPPLTAPDASTAWLWRLGIAGPPLLGVAIGAGLVWRRRRTR